jgi:hypothetical protein
MNVRHLAQLAVLVCLLVGPLGNGAAQHLPEEDIAKGPPEHVLSGINVYKTLLTEAFRRLGQPSRIKVDVDVPGKSTARGSGGVDYTWVKDRVRLVASAEYYEENGKRIESKLYAVEVWGARPTSDGVGVTGAGLALGDTIEKVKKCYGDRFFKGKTSNGTTYLQIEWTDDTQLNIDFDNSGRIAHMQLMASIE